MTVSLNRRIKALLISAAFFPAASLAVLSTYLVLHTSESPALIFPQTRLDLGDLDYDTQANASFPFKNTTSTVLRIKAVKADCGCTDASTSKSVIYPGEEGTIDVAFRSQNKSGPQNHRVIVQTDCPGQETVDLTVSAQVNPRIQLIPCALWFGQIHLTNRPDPREVSVISRFDKPAKTVSASSSSPFVKALLLDAKPAHGREVGRIRITLCGNPPPGNLNATVLVKTQIEKGLVSSSLRVAAKVVCPLFSSYP